MRGWWAASYVVLWAVVLMLCGVVVALARQIGTLHLRLGPRGALEIDDEGPALGEAPEPMSATDIHGTSVTLAAAGEAQLLLFVSPGCRTCDQVLPAVGTVARRHGMTPIVVSDLDPEETVLAFRTKPLDAALVAGAEVSRRYRVPGTPFAVVLDDSGVVRAKGLVNNLEQLEGLADTASARAEARSTDGHLV